MKVEEILNQSISDVQLTVIRSCVLMIHIRNEITWKSRGERVWITKGGKKYL